ncbi:MAG: 2-oxoacid:acceptor oxidoreductase family protein [Proteobacteria bacterium]|nr:2-oxoacid:acceptor oxidoreductase family protein [Pseudomonadota bacterium]
MSRVRIVFSGTGGQGVITASIILAEAAVLHDGLNAVQGQSYGPEARGGQSRSDVIISDTEIRFPKVPQPNILVCLSQEAYNAYSPTIRPGGLLITDSHYVTPAKKVDARQAHLPLYDSVMERIGKPIVLNICTLGAFAGLVPVVRVESLKTVIRKRVPKDFLDLNYRAFDLGMELAGSYGPLYEVPW